MSSFYKMDPAAWDFGTSDLTLEQEGAYLRIVNSIHKHDAPVPLNDRVLAGLFRCSTRRARVLLQALIDAGKVYIEDGFIWNRRARDEVVRRQFARSSLSVRDEFAECSRTIRPSNTARNGDERADNSLKNIDAGGAEPLSRIEENRIEYNTPLPPSNAAPKKRPAASAEHDRFAAFWDSYPKREGNPRKPASEKFSRLVRDGIDPEEIIRGAQGYARARQGQDSKFTKQAVTWLNQQCWTEYAAKAPAKPAPSGPMVQMRDAEHPVALVIDLVAERGFNGLWGALRERWGPPPGEEGCIIPEWIISKAKDELKKSA